MKKHILLVWLLVLTLILTACIQGGLEDTSNTPPSADKPPIPEAPPTGGSTSDSTTQTPPEQTPSPIPEQPNYAAWAGDELTSSYFLATNGIVDTSRAEYSYEAMKEDLSQLAALYPDYFSYTSFGKSVLGRDLYVAVLGDENASQQILITAGIHGREYLTPLLAMKQLEFYLAYYESGNCNGSSYKDLFADACIYVVPMINPDGIMLSQGGLDTVSDSAVRQRLLEIHLRDFNKSLTKETDINNYLKSWKANANGVDLNRNYDAKWNEYVGEAQPSHRNYKGTSPVSEPETQAMVELIGELSNLQAVLCFHSQGEVLYWNCGQETELRDATQQFTKMVAQVTGYYIVPTQNNDASLSDWCELKLGIIAITVETGVGVCPLPVSQFQTIWQQNYHLIAKSAKYFEPNNK